MNYSFRLGLLHEVRSVVSQTDTVTLCLQCHGSTIFVCYIGVNTVSVRSLVVDYVEYSRNSGYVSSLHRNIDDELTQLVLLSNVLVVQGQEDFSTLAVTLQLVG